MKKVATLLLGSLVLAGCVTTPEITPEEYKAQVKTMDDLDICYSLGEEDDFELWKVLYNEKFSRENKSKDWTLSYKACQGAIDLAKNNLEAKRERRRRFAESVDKTVKDVTQSFSNARKQQAAIYSSYKPVRTTCQNISGYLSCTSY